MNTSTFLQLHDIHVHYGGVKALDGVSIKIDEGEIVALMGPNGAGKSTVLKTIFGSAPIESGYVLLNGNQINLKPHELVELGISFVPQGRRVFKHLTVLENIEIGGHAIKSKAVRKERIDEVLDIFPMLKEKLYQKAGELSGGQQQMVALARGIVTAPKLLLLDEPSLGLAPKIVKEVFAKIRDINTGKKIAVLVVEHNLKSLLEITDRAYVLDKGKLVLEGGGKTFLQNDTLEKVFTGGY